LRDGICPFFCGSFYISFDALRFAFRQYSALQRRARLSSLPRAGRVYLVDARTQEDFAEKFMTNWHAQLDVSRSLALFAGRVAGTPREPARAFRYHGAPVFDILFLSARLLLYLFKRGVDTL
jgi:hypothetical protein